MSRSPHTADEVAQARTVVTHFDAMLRDHGAAEACELRDSAWSILLADHAARIATQRFARNVRMTPGDAA